MSAWLEKKVKEEREQRGETWLQSKIKQAQEREQQDADLLAAAEERRVRSEEQARLDAIQEVSNLKRMTREENYNRALDVQKQGSDSVPSYMKRLVREENYNRGLDRKKQEKYAPAVDFEDEEILALINSDTEALRQELEAAKAENVKSGKNDMSSNEAKTLQRELDEVERLQYLYDLENLRDAKDFGTLSQAKEIEKTGNYSLRPSADIDTLYQFINDTGDYDRETVKAMSFGTGQAQTYGGYEEYVNLRSDEKRMYNYLYTTEGKESAEKYLEALKPALEERRYAAHQEYLEDLSDKYPILTSVASVPASVLGGAVSGADLALRYVTGNNINPYNYAQQAGSAAQTIRGSVSEDFSDFGKFLYNTAMSGADSVAASVFGPMGGGVVLGVGAGADNAKDIMQRGGTVDQAILGGLAAGTFEMLFERWSLGNLAALKEIPSTSLKQAVKNTAKSMFVNASEEALTEATNIAFDALTMGDISNWQASINYYMSHGMTEDEATKQVWLDSIGQVGEAAAAGALMGGAFSAAGSIASNNESRRIGMEVNAKEGAADALMEAALQMAEDTETQHKAQMMKASSYVSNADVGNLYRSAIRDTANTYTDENLSKEEKYQRAQRDIDDLVFRNAAQVAQNKKPVAQKAAVPVEQATVAKNATPTQASENIVQQTAPAVTEETKVAESSVAAPAVYNDQAVDVKGVSSVENSTVYVKLADGGVVKAEEVEFDDPNVQELYEKAQNFATDTAKTFVAYYDGSVDVRSYTQGFMAIQGQARNGETFDGAVANAGVYAQKLTPAMQQAAFYAGQNAGKLTDTTVSASAVAAKTEKPAPETASQAEDTETDVVEYTPAKGKKGGVKRVGTKKLTASQQNQINALDVVFKAFGRTVEIVDSIDVKVGNEVRKSAANAMFDPNTNTYRIALDGVGEAYTYFAVHESIHDIKANNPEGYDKLKDVVVQYLKVNGEDVDALVHAQQELGNLSEAAALEEVVANSVPAILTDPETGNLFAQRFLLADEDTRNVFQKLLDSILNFLQKAHDVLVGSERSWQQMEALEADIEAITSIREAYFDALEGLDDVQDTNKTGKTKLSPRIGVMADGRPVYTSNFPEGITRRERQDRILQLIQDVWSKNTIKLEVDRNGRTEVIEARFDPKFDPTGKEYSDASKLAYGNRKGTMSDQKVTEKLADDFPEIISNTKNVGNKDETGKSNPAHKDVAVWHYFAGGIVFVNEKGEFADYNVSVDVKETTQGDDYVYSVAAEKIKGSERMSEPNFRSDPKTILASGNGISAAITPVLIVQNHSDSVKRSLKDSNGNTLTEQQAEYFKDSKVVDEQGRLKIMYRGDDSEFTVFDRKKSRYSNLYGRGFYFTDSETHARQYGGAREFYLNIKNPLPTDETTITRSQMRKFLKAIAENEDDFSFENYGYGATVDSVLKSVYGKSDFAMLYDVNQTAVGDMVAAVELFNDVNGTNFDGLILDTETVAFYSNQAKSTDNLNPTEDSDIRFSFKDDPYERGHEINRLRNRIDELEDGLLFDEDPFSVKQLRKAENELAELLTIERKASVRTSLEDILENLDVYRSSDLESILEQYDRNGEWNDMRADEMREYIRGIAEEYSPLELQSKKNGFYVIPADTLRAARKGNSPESRFSLKDVTPVDVRALEKQNAQLQAVNKTLREQLELTKGRRVSDADTKKIARKVLADYSSKYSVDSLSESLGEIFKYLETNPNPNIDDIMDMGVGLAKAVLEQSSELSTEMQERYAEARNYLRNTGIALSEGQKAAVTRQYGGYNDYRMKLFGSVKIVNNGLSLHDAWRDLAKSYPALFDANASVEDMPALLDVAAQTLKPSYESPYGYDIDEAAYDLFVEIADSAYESLDMGDELFNMRAERRRAYEQALKNLRNDRVAARQELSEQYNNLREQWKSETNKARAASYKEQLDYLRKAYKELSDERVLAIKAKFETKMAKHKDTEERQKYRDRIEKTAKTLAEWLARPTDQKHVPEVLRKSVSDFLQTIEFGSAKRPDIIKAAKWRETLSVLSRTMAQIDAGTGEFVNYYAEIDPDLIPRLDAFIGGTTQIKSVGDMSAEQLKELDFLLGIVKRTVTDANALHANARYANVSRLGDATMSELVGRKNKKARGRLVGGVDALLNVHQLDSFAYFDQLGSAAKTVLGGLRAGLDAKTVRVKQAMDYMEGALKGVDKKALDAMTGKHAKLYAFKTEANQTVQLTTAQVMELYLLNQRPQARGHIYGGGIRPTNIEVKDGRKTVRINNTAPVKVTENDVANIIKVLTPKQIALADQMQSFVGGKVAEWGNEVSMTMYGYKKFTEANYWPIRSDSNYTRTNDSDSTRNNGGGDLYKLKNLGMTKATVQGANNPMTLGDVFDTFVRHVDDMSSYNAFVAPLSDAMKWFNYVDKESGMGSVKQSIERVLGEEGQNYFVNLVRDINGSNNAGVKIGLIDMLMRNAKTAAVGANARVVLQQPTAYVRAAAEISPKYLARAATGFFSKANAEKAKKYSPIAQWKSWGFFDLNVGRSLRELIIGDQTTSQYLKEKSLAPAGWMDERTWGTLWKACELEVRHDNPKLKGEDFNVAVGKRLSEIIDRTQVVDSVLHRSQLMRSKNGLYALYTSFMSEPTKTYNMLRTALADMKRNNNARTRGRFGRVAVSFVATSVATAAAAAIADAFREEDDEKAFLEKWLGSFGANVGDNLNPLGMIPVAKEFVSLMNGYSVSRIDLQGAERVFDFGAEVIRMFEGKSTWNVQKLLYEGAKALSSVTGIPAGNAMRTLVSVYNTAFGDITWQNETATAKATYETMNRALTDGNIDKYSRLYQKMVDEKVAGYKTEEAKRKAAGETLKYADEASMIAAAKAAVDSSMADLLMADPAIEKAYEHRTAGRASALNGVYKELQAKGYNFNTITKAINKYENLVTAEPAENEYDLMKQYDAENLVAATRAAFTSGNTRDAQIIYDSMYEQSKAEDPAKSLKSTASENFRLEYIDMVEKGNAGKVERMADVLIDVFGYDQSDLDDWVKEWRGKQMNDAIAKGDASTANNWIKKMQADGRDYSSIRSSIVNKYKPMIVEAYENGDMTTYNMLVDTLLAIDLYTEKGKKAFTADTISDWLEAEDE